MSEENTDKESIDNGELDEATLDQVAGGDMELKRQISISGPAPVFTDVKLDANGNVINYTQLTRPLP